MRQFLNIPLSGRIDRVNLPNKISDGDVLLRENFMVVGTNDEKRNRKIAGANRFTSADTGDYYNFAYRYYTGLGVRKSFAFNNGKIYFISDNGSETALDPPFSLTARPCAETMRVSSNDVMYFSEGLNTGMYSHDGNIGNIFTKESAVALNFVGLLSHLDRLWGFEEDSENLYFSKNLDPTNFTDSTDAGTITIGAKRGSKIMAIALLYGTIFIFKQDSIWKLEGRTPSEFTVTEVVPYLGTSNRYSVQNTDNGIIFQASDFEFYFFGGTQGSLIMLTDKILMAGDLTKNLIPIINSNKLDLSSSIFHNKIYRCSLVENGGNTPTIEYCFNTLNKTDFFTRGFNISCYMKWDRFPDKNELLTGRIDIGHMMKHNIGLNVDNQSSSPSMRFRLQSKFVGSDEPRNIRFKRAFFNVGVLGAEPINCKYQLDCRTAQSDAGSNDWTTRGEYKTVAGLKISSQNAITSRQNLDYGKSKGQNISFLIDHEGRDVDFEISDISVEAIVKQVKKSEAVGV